ncbi:hypothetical protein V6N13_001509 [Hibiscus sabdariffa]|uniref:Uncharacterized protein n=1 Tax=Hibiscus sabdariffa TaxID=183260 RepID=A0ABR2G8J2_9ROSI
MKFESLDFTEFVPPKSSLEIAPVLELKPLRSHLKYVYLGANDTLPVIISSQLNANQELSFVNLLKQYKKALGWTMADLKGISPTICMHKILLDDCHSCWDIIRKNEVQRNYKIFMSHQRSMYKHRKQEEALKGLQ